MFRDGIEKTAISGKAYVRALKGRAKRLESFRRRIEGERGPRTPSRIGREVAGAENIARNRKTALEKLEKHHPHVRALEIRDKRVLTQPLQTVKWGPWSGFKKRTR